MKNLAWLLTTIPLFTACSPAPETNSALPPAEATAAENSGIKAGVDYHSFSNPGEVTVTHLDLDLTADFAASVLSGSATLTYEKQTAQADTLVVDTRDLTIQSVTANSEALDYQLQPADPELGAALEIDLPEQGSTVTIEYATSPQASGVQWLTPSQTAGKEHPFLFTQAQAVHARSFIPLQDSPQVRVTYNATIHTPDTLLAVMSAANDPDTERDGEYDFTMPQPVPSYLIALAIGAV